LLVSVIGLTAFNLLVTGPGTERALKAVSDRHPNDPGLKMFQGGLMGSLVTASGLLGAAIEFALAAPVLILMFVRSTRDAFSGQASAMPPVDERWSGSSQPPDDWNRPGGTDSGDQGFRPSGRD
jgi:hypothetical protein